MKNLTIIISLSIFFITLYMYLNGSRKIERKMSKIQDSIKNMGGSDCSCKDEKTHIEEDEEEEGLIIDENIPEDYIKSEKEEPKDSKEEVNELKNPSVSDIFNSVYEENINEENIIKNEITSEIDSLNNSIMSQE